MTAHEAAMSRVRRSARQDAVLRGVVRTLATGLEMAGLDDEAPDLDAFLAYTTGWGGLALKDPDLGLPLRAPAGTPPTGGSCWQQLRPSACDSTWLNVVGSEQARKQEWGTAGLHPEYACYNDDCAVHSRGEDRTALLSLR